MSLFESAGEFVFCIGLKFRQVLAIDFAAAFCVFALGKPVNAVLRNIFALSQKLCGLIDISTA